MHCPHCDWVIRKSDKTCPSCGARLPADGKILAGKDKKHCLSLIGNILFYGGFGILALILLVMGCSKLIRSSNIQQSCVLTQGTVVESGDVREEIKRRHSGGRTNHTYYELMVYQPLCVEYTMDGKTFRADLGEPEIHRERADTRMGFPTSDAIIWAYAYEVGDTVEIYANDEGTAYYSDGVSSQTKGSFGFLFGGALIAVLLGKDLVKLKGRK